MKKLDRLMMSGWGLLLVLPYFGAIYLLWESGAPTLKSIGNVMAGLYFLAMFVFGGRWIAGNRKRS